MPRILHSDSWMVFNSLAFFPDIPYLRTTLDQSIPQHGGSLFADPQGNEPHFKYSQCRQYLKLPIQPITANNSPG